MAILAAARLRTHEASDRDTPDEYHLHSQLLCQRSPLLFTTTLRIQSGSVMMRHTGKRGLSEETGPETPSA